MNYILGSGITGCIARRILGSNWTWLPFKRSRYYSFDIPYADTFITHSKDINDFMLELSPGNAVPIFYKRSFSLQGQLMFQELPLLIDPYLSKVFGNEIPSFASKLLKTTFTVYPMTAPVLYHQLENSYLENEINGGIQKFGQVQKIDLDKKTISCSKGIFEWDKIISTIPLNAFMKLCDKETLLKARPICCYYLVTDTVDLEGSDQALVVDKDIDFYKVQMLKKGHYVFYTFDALENAHQYFGKFLNYRLDIIDAKRIDEAIPMGEPPDLKFLQDRGVVCVGSNAQWDDFSDVSSSIRRLLKADQLFDIVGTN